MGIPRRGKQVRPRFLWAREEGLRQDFLGSGPSGATSRGQPASFPSAARAVEQSRESPIPEGCPERCWGQGTQSRGCKAQQSRCRATPQCRRLDPKVTVDPAGYAATSLRTAAANRCDQPIGAAARDHVASAPNGHFRPGGEATPRVFSRDLRAAGFVLSGQRAACVHRRARLRSRRLPGFSASSALPFTPPSGNLQARENVPAGNPGRAYPGERGASHPRNAGFSPP